MTHPKMLIKWATLGLLVVILVACAPAQSPDLSMAGTYAAQTLAAMPTVTDTPEPEEPTPTPTITLTPTPIVIVDPVGPRDFPEDVNPLTGLKVADPEILDRRPVLVKVANHPAYGRPHAGLSLADMVFEYYIGYGGNRFMALYYGQDAPKIGPVRSARLVDPQITSMYEGVLGFEGAYITILNQIYDILGNRAISGKDQCPAICDDGRGIVTSVFANSLELTLLAEERGVPTERLLLEGMAFDPDAPENGESGERVNIHYSSLNWGDWLFDEDSGLYLRWIDDGVARPVNMIPLVDSETDEQLAFSNVVVIFANYIEFAPSLHDIELWGNDTGGRAMVFRDGQAYEVTWVTPQNNQPIQFLDEDGEVFPLKNGNTWVSLFGINSRMSTEDGEWTFNFALP